MGPAAAPAVGLVGAFHGTPNQAMKRRAETGIVTTGQNRVNGPVRREAPFRGLFPSRCRWASAVVNSPPLAADGLEVFHTCGKLCGNPQFQRGRLPNHSKRWSSDG